MVLPRERGEVDVDASTDRDYDGDGDDERELIVAAQADPRAFGPLYRRYLMRVYRFVRAQMPNDDDAADITQQVFLRALSALPAYRLEGPPFSAWLFRIARHAAIDIRRRQRPSVAWERLPEALTPEGERDPEETYLRAEALARLRELVVALDADKRELLALRFAGQLSSTEIAAVVGKQPEAVRKMLTRTLHALKEHYHET
jgi:RNA polymerase sigma-70 factor, ECF subfamily